MRPALFLLPLALAACEDRRDFDERYRDTAANLQAKARTLDQQANAPAGNEVSPEPTGNSAG